MRWFAERLADRLVAPQDIQAEFFKVPQIGKPMVKRVVYQKMPGRCNRASLFRPGRNLASNHTEASFHPEFAQYS
jgi:hypothetical protein